MPMNIIDLYRTRPVFRGSMQAGAAIALAAFLSGCAGAPDCLKTQRYENAQVFPKLKDSAGLSVPKPDPDMQIPNITSGPVARYSVAPQGTDADNPRARCLTTPPPINTSGAG